MPRALDDFDIETLRELGQKRKRIDMRLTQLEKELEQAKRDRQELTSRNLAKRFNVAHSTINKWIHDEG